jgi:hypothetical protein
MKDKKHIVPSMMQEMPLKIQYHCMIKALKKLGIEEHA